MFGYGTARRQRPGCGHRRGNPSQPANAAARAAPQRPSHLIFTTRHIAPEGKFETWRDLWVRNLFEMDMSAPSPETFDGTMELWNAGPLSVAHLAARAGTWSARRAKPITAATISALV